MICSATTFPRNAGPVEVQNGDQLEPSQTARKSAFALPPAFWNVPPAKTLPPEVAIAITMPFEICDVGELTALQLLPSQIAMRSALGLPPASVKLPPT